MAKHAPGPWTILDAREMDGGYWIEVMHPNGYPVSIASVRSGCDEADELGDVLTNANLIAVAPEMLAVCESLETALAYPRGSEAQVRCLEEIAQDAARVGARVKGGAT